jgi:16S rRNA (cytidine1402-2'-O)-methyltransferase
VTGRLVLVGTPVGNLGDLSPRAEETLREADVVCCEDTRHSRKLFSHVGITPKRLVAVHEHNEREMGETIAGWVLDGRVVALITDAGMPGISDPGERVVAAVVAAGGTVEVVPGPSAVLAALVASGLPTARFCFEGFLPRKGRERATAMARIAAEERTTVLFEAPNRVAATLADLAAACGDDRRVAVARELTKKFEEHWRGTVADAAARARAKEPMGEHVLVVEGAPAPDVGDHELEVAVRDALGSGLTVRDAARRAADELDVPRNRAYALARRISAGDPPAAS